MDVGRFFLTSPAGTFFNCFLNSGIPEISLTHSHVLFCIGVENPTYLKESGDKAVVAVALAGVGIGLLVIGRGLYSMMLGVNKVK